MPPLRVFSFGASTQPLSINRSADFRIAALPSAAAGDSRAPFVQGLKARILIPGILTLARSPSEGEREFSRRFGRASASSLIGFAPTNVGGCKVLMELHSTKINSLLLSRRRQSAGNPWTLTNRVNSRRSVALGSRSQTSCTARLIWVWSIGASA